MRSKSILSIAAFIIAFAGSVALASLFITKTAPSVSTYSDYSRSTSCWKSRSSYQSPTARGIAELIRQDKENGMERGRKLFRIGEDFRPAFESESYAAYAEAVEEYVDASMTLDASDYPRDFQTAWRKHMKAWRDYSEFLNEMKTSSDRKKIEMQELLETDNEYSSEINLTWYEVLRIGRTYGANVY